MRRSGEREGDCEAGIFFRRSDGEAVFRPFDAKDMFFNSHRELKLEMRTSQDRWLLVRRQS